MVSTHPDVEVKVTVAVPCDTPVTVPLEEPIVATLVPEILHVPLLRSDSVDVYPAQKEVAPVIGDGGAVTDILLVFVPVHPFPSVTDKVTG